MAHPSGNQQNLTYSIEFVSAFIGIFVELLRKLLWLMHRYLKFNFHVINSLKRTLTQKCSYKV